MDKHRVAGAGKELKGNIKEAAGKITGDDKLKHEGQADQIAGKAEKVVGKAKDAVRDATRKD